MNNFNDLEAKYIELILKRCLSFNSTKSLLIHVETKENLAFANRVSVRAKELGVLEVIIRLEDIDEVHTYLKETALADIKLNSLIDRTIWNDFAGADKAILFMTTTVPGIMDDINPEKIKKMADIKSLTMPNYLSKVVRYDFPWSIVALPNQRWAKTVFPDDPNSYEKLYYRILKMCMIDQPDPVRAWEDYIISNNYYKSILNNLQIKKLHYTNTLGTDLEITLPDNAIWLNLDKQDKNGNPILVNMPSYEIFTSPDFRYTNGVVYNSRPLVYNGAIIDYFYLEFQDGRVKKTEAKIGHDVLNNFLAKHNKIPYLGEVALVNNDSPISLTGKVFYNTLYDENASCHLAFGRANPNAIPNGKAMSKEELTKNGINIAPAHLDFMIGTPDLNIEAECNQGKKLIFKQGSYNL